MGRNKGVRYYIIKNLETGQRLKGKSTELAQYIGCSVSTISKYEREGRIFKGIWEIECFDIGDEEEDALTEEDLQKWDNFIRAWNKKFQKHRLRKPQRIV